MSEVQKIIKFFQAGNPVILIDDQDRENEGDIVVASDCMTEEHLNLMEKHARGLVCVSISYSQAKKLELSLQSQNNNAPFQTAFTKSVSLKSSGLNYASAQERVKCIKSLANPKSCAEEFISPGNIYPLIAKKSGTIDRDGQTEGSHDLARIAGFNPSGVICEILNPDGTMARGDSLEKFANEFKLPVISVAQVLRYRIENEILLKESDFKKNVLTEYGTFNVHVINDEVENKEHYVLTYGNIKTDSPVLVRVHSECLTGDVFGSRRCDCGNQLKQSFEKIKQVGAGIVIYLRQEGRGIGLLNKIKAYELQDRGLDTVEANIHLGFEVDKRDFLIAAKIIQMLEINSINLLTNNPKKVKVMNDFGITIANRVPIITAEDPYSKDYIETKKNKLGHLFK